MPKAEFDWRAHEEWKADQDALLREEIQLLERARGLAPKDSEILHRIIWRLKTMRGRDL